MGKQPFGSEVTDTAEVLERLAFFAEPGIGRHGLTCPDARALYALACRAEAVESELREIRGAAQITIDSLGVFEFMGTDGQKHGIPSNLFDLLRAEIAKGG